jgi:hypothetical protein
MSSVPRPKYKGDFEREVVRLSYQECYHQSADLCERD